MGTKFFQAKPPRIGAPANLNMEARALSAGQYGGRVAAGNANKDIAAAIGMYQKHGFKPQDRSAAYPKGPKT